MSHRLARGNARRANSSSGVAAAIAGAGGASQRRAGAKDHHRENIRQMRAKARRDRERREAAEREAASKVMFKLARFDNVESQVFKHDQGRRSADDRSADSAAAAGKKQFLRRGSGRLSVGARSARGGYGGVCGGDKEQPDAATAYVSHKKKVRPAVPTAAELREKEEDERRMRAERPTQNYLKSNSIAAKKATPRRKAQPAEEPAITEDFGKVPEYLKERKRELQELEEQRLREAEEARVPPGLMVMPEDERLKTIETLERKYAEVRESFVRLPVVIETPTMVRKQAALEDKLKQIEEALEVFRRPVVFIQE